MTLEINGNIEDHDSEESIKFKTYNVLCCNIIMESYWSQVEKCRNLPFRYIEEDNDVNLTKENIKQLNEWLLQNDQIQDSDLDTMFVRVDNAEA